MLVLLACAPNAEQRQQTALAAAEAARELEALHEITVLTLEPEEWVERFNTDLPEAYLDELVRVYARLGFFDPELDIQATFGDQADLYAAAYDHRNDEIWIVGEPDTDILVHEYVHALQDQHFDLDAFDDVETSDQFLARRAVTEGDATLAQLRYVAREEGLELEEVDFAGYLGGYRAYGENVLRDGGVPPLFADYASFCYPWGLAFTTKNLTGATLEAPEPTRPTPFDWSREDALFEPGNAPRTAEQVVRLSEAPIPSVTLTGAVPDGLEIEMEDVLGQWYSYLLFYEIDPEAFALAASWDGDRLLAITRHDGATGVAWASAWADEDAVARVEADLVALHGIVDNRAADGEDTWLERRGTTLVFVKNLPEDDARFVAQSFFAPAEARRAARMGPLRPFYQALP